MNVEQKDKHKDKVTIPLEGMSCATCAITIEKALSDLPGVSQANVNFASEKATVEYDPDKVDAGKMVKTVADAGYSVDIQRTTFGVGGMTCASCVSHVEKALLEVKGVISAFVNLATEKATVEYLCEQGGHGH
jgi:Cu+-exporting ATPase